MASRNVAYSSFDAMSDLNRYEDNVDVLDSSDCWRSQDLNMSHQFGSNGSHLIRIENRLSQKVSGIVRKYDSPNNRVKSFAPIDEMPDQRAKFLKELNIVCERTIDTENNDKYTTELFPFLLPGHYSQSPDEQTYLHPIVLNLPCIPELLGFPRRVLVTPDGDVLSACFMPSCLSFNVPPQFVRSILNGSTELQNHYLPFPYFEKHTREYIRAHEDSMLLTLEYVNIDGFRAYRSAEDAHHLNDHGFDDLVSWSDVVGTLLDRGRNTSKTAYQRAQSRVVCESVLALLQDENKSEREHIPIDWEAHMDAIAFPFGVHLCDPEQHRLAVRKACYSFFTYLRTGRKQCKPSLESYAAPYVLVDMSTWQQDISAGVWSSVRKDENSISSGTDNSLAPELLTYQFSEYTMQIKALVDPCAGGASAGGNVMVNNVYGGGANTSTSFNHYSDQVSVTSNSSALTFSHPMRRTTHTGLPHSPRMLSELRQLRPFKPKPTDILPAVPDNSTAPTSTSAPVMSAHEDSVRVQQQQLSIASPNKSEQRLIHSTRRPGCQSPPPSTPSSSYRFSGATTQLEDLSTARNSELFSNGSSARSPVGTKIFDIHEGNELGSHSSRSNSNNSSSNNNNGSTLKKHDSKDSTNVLVSQSPMPPPHPPLTGARTPEPTAPQFRKFSLPSSMISASPVTVMEPSCSPCITMNSPKPQFTDAQIEQVHEENIRLHSTLIESKMQTQKLLRHCQLTDRFASRMILEYLKKRQYRQFLRVFLCQQFAKQFQQRKRIFDSLLLIAGTIYQFYACMTALPTYFELQADNPVYDMTQNWMEEVASYVPTAFGVDKTIQYTQSRACYYDGFVKFLSQCGKQQVQSEKRTRCCMIKLLDLVVSGQYIVQEFASMFATRYARVVSTIEKSMEDVSNTNNNCRQVQVALDREQLVSEALVRQVKELKSEVELLQGKMRLEEVKRTREEQQRQPSSHPNVFGLLAPPNVPLPRRETHRMRLTEDGMSSTDNASRSDTSSSSFLSYSPSPPPVIPSPPSPVSASPTLPISNSSSPKPRHQSNTASSSTRNASPNKPTKLAVYKNISRPPKTLGQSKRAAIKNPQPRTPPTSPCLEPATTAAAGTTTVENSFPQQHINSALDPLSINKMCIVMPPLALPNSNTLPLTPTQPVSPTNRIPTPSPTLNVHAPMSPQNSKSRHYSRANSSLYSASPTTSSNNIPSDIDLHPPPVASNIQF